MYNGDEEDPYFIVTHKEQEMLMQFRELSDEERKEVEKKSGYRMLASFEQAEN